MPIEPDLDGRDDQDGAETLDEETLGVPDDERETFEELTEVLDVTSAVGDGDDDEALIAEDLDDDEIVALEEDASLADPEDDALEARAGEIGGDRDDRAGAGPHRRDQ